MVVDVFHSYKSREYGTYRATTYFNIIPAGTTGIAGRSGTAGRSSTAGKKSRKSKRRGTAAPCLEADQTIIIIHFRQAA